MSFSYDPSLPTDRDWVRLLTADTNIARPRLHDEEIDAVVTEEGNKYLAAARCGELLIAATGNLVRKEVDDLKLQYSEGDEGTAYREYLCGLRNKGMLEKNGRPRYFETY